MPNRKRNSVALSSKISILSFYKNILCCSKEIESNLARLLVSFHFSHSCKISILRDSMRSSIWFTSYLGMETSPQSQSMQPMAYLAPLSHSPQRTTCPSCHAQVMTVVVYESTMKTHIMAWCFSFLLLSVL